MAGRVVTVQKLPEPEIDPNREVEDLLASFCYHFPQYPYHIAKKLSFSRVKRMLKVAQREHAKNMIDLLNIQLAPHSKKGKAQNLLEYFKKVAKGEE